MFQLYNSVFNLDMDNVYDKCNNWWIFWKISWKIPAFEPEFCGNTLVCFWDHIFQKFRICWDFMPGWNIFMHFDKCSIPSMKTLRTTASIRIRLLMHDCTPPLHHISNFPDNQNTAPLFGSWFIFSQNPTDFTSNRCRSSLMLRRRRTSLGTPSGSTYRQWA